MRLFNQSTATLFVSVLILSLLSVSTGAEAAMTIQKEAFGSAPDGTPVDLYTLRNDNGIEVKITNYEGIVVSVLAPDHAGKVEDIVLGYDTLAEYMQHDPYFGGITDKQSQRFDNIVWNVTEFTDEEEVGLEFRYASKMGDEASLSVTAVYTLNTTNELKIRYTAMADQETAMSLTNHIYFNLAGAGAGDVLDHEILIRGDSFYPLEQTLKPIDEIRSVYGTPMDYRQSAAIRPRLAEENEQVRLDRGYQHIWKLTKEDDSLSLAARLYEPTTKRVVEIRTTATGMWFETGNFMDGTITGKGNKVYERHSGLTLAAHDLSPTPGSSADFPSIVVKPGETYTHTTVYKFFAL